MAAFEAWQIELIDSLRVARLATLAPGGVPALVPVCYALLDGHIYIAVDEKPKTTANLARLRNIERDPRVSLLFDRYEDDWARLAWVRVEGTATVLHPGGGRPAALAALRSRYLQYRAMDLESRPLVVVEPQRIVSWRWGNG